jgi:pimeloyl-ACP methyl ester carboxylesterase
MPGLGRRRSRLWSAKLGADTVALMDAQGWPWAHLIGHSMGGVIALEVALAARHRVRSLSLLCAFPWGRDATRLTPGMLWTGTIPGARFVDIPDAAHGVTIQHTERINALLLEHLRGS